MERKRPFNRRKKCVYRIDFYGNGDYKVDFDGTELILCKKGLKLLSLHSWRKLIVGKKQNKCFYLVRRSKDENKMLFFHRELIDAPPSKCVDHINQWNDNRILNLRICNKKENAINRRPQSGRKFKGVYRNNKNGDRFRARILINGKNKTIGTFETEELAALAFDKAAKELHGEFAYLNFPNHSQF